MKYLRARHRLTTCKPGHGIRRPGAAPGLVHARQAATAVEFAICGLVMALMIVGFIEFGRLVWAFEVLQEVASEGARCMGLGASSCTAAGVYNAPSTTTYLVALANARGVVINAGMVSLNSATTCGGAGGFSKVTINYSFQTVAPTLLTSLASGLTVAATACFPNNT